MHCEVAPGFPVQLNDFIEVVLARPASVAIFHNQ